jgi:Flp pilus assembly protein protease CpaA
MLLLGGWRVLSGAGYAVRTIASRYALSFGGWIPYRIGNAQALSSLLFLVVAWGFCFALWELHVMGGGDAKTLMGLVALFPRTEFAVFIAAAVLVLSLPLLLLKLRRKGMGSIPKTLRGRLRRRAFFPTQQELEEQGQPYAWTFCLPGVIYLWFLW